MDKTTALKVLSLEDSLPDFEIISKLLSDAGYILNISRVETEADFAASLQNGQYEIILADFNLPGFDAFGALRMRNEWCPDVPFICVSGSIGEELAIELLKLGASDYVLKDRPVRLPSAIRRALGEAKEKANRRKAETALRKLSRAVEQSPNAVVITDLNGTIEYANPIASKVTGYALDELIGSNPRVLSSGEMPPEGYKKLWESIKSGKEWVGEFHNKKKSGELYWESATISPIQDENGEISNFLAIKEDITERKKADQIQRVIFNISYATSTTDNLEQLVLQIQRKNLERLSTPPTFTWHYTMPKPILYHCHFLSINALILSRFQWKVQ